MEKSEKSLKDLLEFSIINIDKPAGPTSFSVSHFVHKILGVNKTSHFGTLDPQVTGVLPIALNRACKLTGFFLGHDKTYVGVMHVHKEIELKELQEIINKKFIGKIKQLPPKKSAVRRAIREREIISFEILEKDGKNFLFKTKVQGGTYIRKLIHDLGEELGVQVEGKLQHGGAHMEELRRVEAGVFSETDSITLYELERMSESELKKAIMPAEEAIKKVMPFVQAKPSSLRQLLTGKPLFEKDLAQQIPDEDVFSVFLGERLIGIYRKVKENDIIAKPQWVYN